MPSYIYTTATDYGQDGPGSNPGGDEVFQPSRPAQGPTQPPVKCVPGLSRGVKCGRGVLLTIHHFLVPRSWKSRAIALPTLWATPGLITLRLPSAPYIFAIIMWYRRKFLSKVWPKRLTVYRFVVGSLAIVQKTEVENPQHIENLTFRGPCIVIYSYNESQRDALFLKFIW
jgi:hypothetical protein